MLALILFSAMLVMLFAPETPIAKALHRALVAWPARQLSRIHRGHVIIALAAVVVITLTAVFFERDGVMLLRLGSPEALPMLASLELASYVDALTALAMVAMTARFGAAARAIRNGAGRIARLLGQRPRPRTPHQHRPSNPDDQDDAGANDNEDDRTAVRAAA